MMEGQSQAIVLAETNIRQIEARIGALKADDSPSSC